METDKILPTQKYHEANSTKFKLCVYYGIKPNMQPYTHVEKLQKKNRKYHDSYDYINITGGKTITRHDMALNKLLHYLEQYKERIEFALLYMNDFANNEQHLIGKFFRDEVRSIFVMPEFAEDSYTKTHVLVSGLQSPPLETVPLQRVKLIKKAA
jgi:hypothetical protein